MDDLTQVVLNFQNGHVTEKEATAQVAIFLFRYLDERYGRSEDENSDLLAEFFPRIPRMLRKFRFQGVPFLHYLKRSVSMQKKTLTAKKWKEKRYEYVICENESLAVMEQMNSLGPADDESGYIPPSLIEGRESSRRTARRRLLLAALRAAPHLSDDQIEQVSVLSQTDLAWLQSWIYKIRREMQPKQQKLNKLICRRSQLYSRRLLVEKELTGTEDLEDQIRLRDLNQKLRRSQQRLQKNIQGIQIVPTHLDLAKILNLPKGTVDSCLYYLKNSFDQGYIGPHDPSSHQQPPQEDGIRSPHAKLLPRPEAPPACRHRTDPLGPRGNS